MAGGPTLAQLRTIKEIRVEDCICLKMQCKGCVQWRLGGCEKCYRPAYSLIECEKCKQEE
jgi:hypothetical protein